MRGRIDGLIRLQRWQLDEKRRHLVELEDMRADFERRLTHLEEEISREKAVAAGDPDASFRFGEFLNAARARRQSIEDSIANIDGEIEGMRDEVQAAFQELKKLETVDARQQEERKATQNRRQQSALDELAISRFQRAASGR